MGTVALSRKLGDDNLPAGGKRVLASAGECWRLLVGRRSRLMGLHLGHRLWWRTDIASISRSAIPANGKPLPGQPCRAEMSPPLSAALNIISTNSSDHCTFSTCTE